LERPAHTRMTAFSNTAATRGSDGIACSGRVLDAERSSAQLLRGIKSRIEHIFIRHQWGRQHASNADRAMQQIIGRSQIQLQVHLKRDLQAARNRNLRDTVGIKLAMETMALAGKQHLARKTPKVRDRCREI